MPFRLRQVGLRRIRLRRIRLQWEASLAARGAALLLAVSAMHSIAVAADEAKAEFAVAPNVRQLFLDDVGIGKLHNLQRTLHPGRRQAGNPLITPDKPWEHYCSQYGTVFFDPSQDLFRMWYLTLPRDRGLRLLELGDGRIRAPHTTLAAYAESRDGLKWTKPALAQFPFDGNRDNNIVELGKYNCEGLSILVDAHEADPARRYKAIYWDHGSGGYEARDGKPFSKDGPEDGLCAAVSSDAVRWQPLAENPVIRKYCDTQQNLLWDPRLARYVAFSRFGMGRVLARSESADFVHWSDPALVLRCDEADGPGAQIYGAGVDLYEGVYLALLAVYHEGTDATIDTQLVTSRDGIHWTRVGDRKVWLALGDADSWEGGMVRTMPHIIPRDDELWIYYGGVHGAHNRPGHPPVERKHRAALGLVTQRRDGFVSLDAGDEAGWLMTAPFVLPAGELHLNVDAQDGKVSAVLCDADGKSLGAASAPITGNRLDAVCPLEGAAARVGQSVRLRIDAQHAKIYSYWFAPAEK